MKKQLLAQISSTGKLINTYESPESASIDDRNRYDPHEIRIALLSNVTYRGFEWKWMDEDAINTLRKHSQER